MRQENKVGKCPVWFAKPPCTSRRNPCSTSRQLLSLPRRELIKPTEKLPSNNKERCHACGPLEDSGETYCRTSTSRLVQTSSDHSRGSWTVQFLKFKLREISQNIQDERFLKIYELPRCPGILDHSERFTSSNEWKQAAKAKVSNG